MMEIKKFAEYNSRRYGKPWGALITIENGTLKYNFCGQYSGFPGDAGTLWMPVSEGDIIAYGQKDSRGNNSIHRFRQIKDGQMLCLERDDVFKMLLEKNSA